MRRRRPFGAPPRDVHLIRFVFAPVIAGLVTRASGARGGGERGWWRRVVVVVVVVVAKRSSWWLALGVLDRLAARECRVSERAREFT
jgi:hypothetical protein